MSFSTSWGPLLDDWPDGTILLDGGAGGSAYGVQKLKEMRRHEYPVRLSVETYSWSARLSRTPERTWGSWTSSSSASDGKQGLRRPGPRRDCLIRPRRGHPYITYTPVDARAGARSRRRTFIASICLSKSTIACRMYLVCTTGSV